MNKALGLSKGRRWKMNEEQLRKLITEVSTLKRSISKMTKASPGWKLATKQLRKKLNQLFLLIKQLFQPPSGLPKHLYCDYEELLEDVLIEALDKICEFQPQRKEDSISNSLKIWINNKLRLKYKVKNLYPKEKKYKSPRWGYNHQAKLPPISLDTPLKGENKETQESFADILPDNIRHNSLEELDNFQKKIHREKVAHELQDYIKQDPYGKLQNCHPPTYPDCNAQKIAKMLSCPSFYKPNGCPNWQAVAEELSIPYKAFWSWKNTHFLPLLRKITKTLALELNVGFGETS